MCAARGGPGYKYCTKISKQLNINDNQNEQKWLTLENVNLTWKNNDLFYLFLLLFVQENLIKKETETKKTMPSFGVIHFLDSLFLISLSELRVFRVDYCSFGFSSLFAVSRRMWKLRDLGPDGTRTRVVQILSPALLVQER